VARPVARRTCRFGRSTPTRMLAHRASADLLSRMEAAPLRERWDPTPFRRSCHSAGVNDGGRRFPLKTAKSRGRSPRLCPYEHLPARRLRAEIDEVFASSGNLAEAIEQVARSGRAAVVADGVGGGADVLGKGTSPWHANHEGDCVEARPPEQVAGSTTASHTTSSMTESQPCLLRSDRSNGSLARRRFHVRAGAQAGTPPRPGDPLS
jgi:hypothetical protein